MNEIVNMLTMHVVYTTLICMKNYIKSAHIDILKFQWKTLPYPSFLQTSHSIYPSDFFGTHVTK